MDDNPMNIGIERRGTVLTAIWHVITILLGSGVLALAWSFAQLGWVAGPIVLVSMAALTYFTSALLADCYRYPDPVTGTVNPEYIDAVRCYLGPRNVFWCGFIQYASIWATLLGYTITASDSASAVRKVNCLHHGDGSKCASSDYFATYAIIVFGAVQILLSQLPSLHNISWLSFFSVATSCIYSTISLGLCFAKWATHNKSHGTVFGAVAGSGLDKATNVFLAVGNIAFTYAYADVQIEIQDTLKAPPAENKTMKKASLYGLSISTVFCMLLGVSGYAAFGNSVSGNILTGTAVHEPFWLIHLANICVILHFIGAYQVFAQPIFARMETYVAHMWPASYFVTTGYDLYVMGWLIRLSFMKLVLRTGIIIFTTLVATLMPFFNPVLGLIGAVGFWPLSVYFPVSMHLTRLKIGCRDSRWWLLHTLSMLCLALSIFMGSASVLDIVTKMKGATIFKTAD
ncbi:amino acid permease 6-like [Aegilops tauschii subsp. strangulata]|nr:amino acid permease 6-like [Aegilops tauschii subsp. strangulata]